MQLLNVGFSGITGVNFTSWWRQVCRKVRKLCRVLTKNACVQGKDRINVTDNNDPSDITGGYIGEYKHGQNEKGQPTINGTFLGVDQWNVVFPKQENLTEAQLDYFQK